MNRLVSVPERMLDVSSLLIPLAGRHLLLPNVSVAEVIPWREPELLADRPAWLLGLVSWREQSVPVVAFERINDEVDTAPGTGRRIVVLNNVTGDPNLPFCAIVCAGTPRLTRVVPDELVSDPDAAAGPMERCRVRVAGEDAGIPDLELLQRSLLAVL